MEAHTAEAAAVVPALVVIAEAAAVEVAAQAAEVAVLPADKRPNG